MDFPRAVLVFFIFLAFYLVLQCYLFFRVQRYLRARFQEKGLRTGLLCAVSLFFLLMLFPPAWRFFYGYRFHDPHPWWFLQTLFDLFAVWGFGSTGSAVLLLAYDGLRRFAVVFSPAPAAPPDLARRAFLKKGLGMAAAAPFVVSGYGVALGRHRFVTDHFDLPLNGLSSDLAQLSIVQLTDIHVGPFMPAEELAAYVEAVNRLRPDVIVLTGDFISTSLEEVAPCVDTLADLKARYGIFACMGNHDVFARAEGELTRRLRHNGVSVLRNDAVSLPIGNTSLNILGIDDLDWGRPDFSRALEVAEKKPGEVQILLSHRPEIFPKAARTGLEVVLSGHYHGGQVKLAPEPDALSIARLITPYAEGLFHWPRRRLSSPGSGGKGALLFVGRGIGITGLPIRINCPPQIAHLTLRRA